MTNTTTTTTTATVTFNRARACEWAKELRDRRIAELEKIDFRVKPTKGIDSGAGGKKFELLQTRDTSTKKGVSGESKVDNYMNLEHHAQAVEMKTNSGEITTTLAKVASGKGGYIVYSLEMNNANTSHKWRVVPAVIMKAETFVRMATECECIRAKKTSRGTITYALEASSKKWYNALNAYIENTGLIYDKNAVYTKDMFE